MYMEGTSKIYMYSNCFSFILRIPHRYILHNNKCVKNCTKYDFDITIWPYVVYCQKIYIIINYKYYLV